MLCSVTAPCISSTTTTAIASLPASTVDNNVSAATTTAAAAAATTICTPSRLATIASIIPNSTPRSVVSVQSSRPTNVARSCKYL